MVSHMDNESQLFERFINTSVKLFASETPFYMVRGNHESRGVYAKQYLNYFPTPTGMPYYTFKEGPVFFIVMDGGEDKPDNDIEYLGTAAFDQYREEEAEWLRKVVESDDFKSSPFKVAVIPSRTRGYVFMITLCPCSSSHLRRLTCSTSLRSRMGKSSIAVGSVKPLGRSSLNSSVRLSFSSRYIWTTCV